MDRKEYSTNLPGPGGTSEAFDSLSTDFVYRKGGNSNRNEWQITFEAEKIIYSDRISAYVQLPYHYYDQKKRKDAGRYGRPRLGLRAHYGWDWIQLQSDLAMASGADRDRFVDENFYDSSNYITASTKKSGYYMAIRVGAIFPIGKLPEPGQPDPSRPAYEPEEEIVSRETHNLKKVTIWEGFLVYRVFKNTIVFARILYRVPYAGTLQEKDSSGLAPGYLEKPDLV